MQESVIGSTFTGRYRWHDRAKGEIDLLYARSVYYGEGAAFIQVDVDLGITNDVPCRSIWSGQRVEDGLHGAKA